MEPCNYVSNVAYYHSATRICQYPEWFSGEESALALKRSYASLALGSAFWHGSYTAVGNSFDNQMISIIAYISHQISVSNLDSNSTVLKEISLTKRNKTGIEVSTDMVQMFIDKPVPYWDKMLEVIERPDYEGNYIKTFGCLVSTAMAFLLPKSLSTVVIHKLAYALEN